MLVTEASVGYFQWDERKRTRTMGTRRQNRTASPGESPASEAPADSSAKGPCAYSVDGQGARSIHEVGINDVCHAAHEDELAGDDYSLALVAQAAGVSRRTKVQLPSKQMARIGLAMEIDGYEVQASQNRDLDRNVSVYCSSLVEDSSTHTASAGAANSIGCSRTSGGTGFGASLRASVPYLGLKLRDSQCRL